MRMTLSWSTVCCQLARNRWGSLGRAVFDVESFFQGISEIGTNFTVKKCVVGKTKISFFNFIFNSINVFQIPEILRNHLFISALLYFNFDDLSYF